MNYAVFDVMIWQSLQAISSLASQPHNHYIFLLLNPDLRPPAATCYPIACIHGGGDSLACFDRSDPLPVDDSSPFSAPSPFIPSMHFFIGRIWDPGSKEWLGCVPDFFNRYPLYIALGAPQE